MALQFLFFLLPIAALSGWWIGRRARPPTREVEVSEIPRDYIKGLNYLLNEQPDKALDLFIRMLEVDRDTVETHLALGSLFRRRGEVDRAIRIHQNLIARPTLTREQRAEALFELGHDYMRAGLFDRAESLFQDLIDSEPHTEQALVQLIDIYQQEKDWDKAIEVARKLEQVSGRRLSPVIAQYYCELADHAQRKGETVKSAKMLRRALATDRACVRASLLEGGLHLAAGNLKAAIRAYRHVEEQDPDYVPEVIEPMLEAYRRQGRPNEMLDYLQQMLERHGGISVMLALAELIRQQRGDDAAAEFITGYLRRRPSVRGMDRLIELHLANSQGPGREELSILKELTSSLLDDRPIYKCHACGYAGKTLHWQCPSCKSWNTTKPILGVEGE